MPSLTRKRDLRTGVSYWQSRPMPRVPSTQLVRDIETDVLVVGAGISGALVAEALSKDHRVVIVDRRGPVKGSTPASTALVEYEIDTPLIELGRQDRRRQRGAGMAAVAPRAPRACRADTALDIHCDAIQRDKLYLAGNVLERRWPRRRRQRPAALSVSRPISCRAHDLKERFRHTPPGARSSPTVTSRSIRAASPRLSPRRDRANGAHAPCAGRGD